MTDLPSVEQQEDLLEKAEDRLREIINQWFPKGDEEAKQFRILVKQLLGTMKSTPASYKTEYHGAWAGGLLVHTVQVIDLALLLSETLRSDLGQTTEEHVAFQQSLIKACFLHDLGKIGNTDNDYYLEQDNEWRRNNLGEMFVINRDTEKLPYLPVPVRSLWLAQRWGVKLTEREMQAVIASDGPATPLGKQVIASLLECPLTTIVHFADLWVSQVRGV